MVKLRKFEEADIPRLIGGILDARFLLQVEQRFRIQVFALSI